MLVWSEEIVGLETSYQRDLVHCFNLYLQIQRLKI